jgi:hypothetical protein
VSRGEENPSRAAPLHDHFVDSLSDPDRQVCSPERRQEVSVDDAVAFTVTDVH